MKGEEWTDGAGAKSLGLENYRRKLFAPTVRLSTKSRLGSSLQEMGKFFICFCASPGFSGCPIPSDRTC